ncbi:hypothetical protein TNCV_1756311 [Trichonephila clavipes]|nr:hypothetical protein TNCV_1756311 [Trichonephila clavipes]
MFLSVFGKWNAKRSSFRYQNVLILEVEGLDWEGASSLVNCEKQGSVATVTASETPNVIEIFQSKQTRDSSAIGRKGSVS